MGAHPAEAGLAGGGSRQVHPISFYRHLVHIDGVPMLDMIEPYRQDILTNGLYTFRADGHPLYKRVLTGRAKKTFKTTDAMLAALYKLFAWQAVGGKGNQIYIVASDLAQANDDLDLLKKLIRCNPILDENSLIKSNIVELKDGTGFIEILPARDAQSLHGKTYLLLVVDELHTQKDYKLLEALELDRTRPDAMQWFASYASMYHHKGVPLVDIQRQFADQIDPRLYVSWYSGTIEEANPSLNTPYGPTLEDIEDAKRSLPSWIFRRLYLNLPGQPDGAAFDAEQVEAAIITGRTVLRPVPGIDRKAGCDLSGGGGDDATLAIARNENGKGILELLIDQGASARVNGVFSPERSVKRFAAILKQYGLTSVVGDRYAAQWPVQEFAKHGITYTPAELNRSEIYAAFEPLLNSGRVELLDHPRLMQQLIGLIRKGEKIDHASGDHDDHANSAALALVLVTQAHQNVPYMVDFRTGKILTERELWQRGMIA